MNKMRINNEEEVVKAKGYFKLPIVTYVIYGLLCILIIVTIILGVALKEKLTIYNSKTLEVVFPFYLCFIIAAVVLLIIFTIIFLLRKFGLKKAELVVTNKRIYGKYGIIIVHKSFSYRLDEINNIEHKNFLGKQSIIIQFEQGKGPNAVSPIQYGTMITNVVGSNVLVMECISNVLDVYNVLNDMLVSVKNQFDTKIDIKMNEIDTEKRKAVAIESIANSINNNNSTSIKKEKSYITELRDLKKLLDDGVITKEEFEQEKKEILDKSK